MKKVFLLALIFGLFGQTVFSQEFDKAKLEKFFDVLQANNKFMGSVALSKNGEIIYSRAVGFADVENQMKAEVDSKFRIGSISKTFTSVLVMKGVEERRIDLEQTIDKFFPTIKNSSKIKIGHLLYHRSGIHNFTNDKEYLTWNTIAKTEKEMVEIITNAGSDFEPDTKAEYSNSNFVLLTFILEKAFKKSYSEILTKYIIKPLELKNTYLGAKINSSNNECLSYRFAGKWEKMPETDISIPLGAGGIVSTTSDLVKFSDALFGGKLLKPESLKKMKTVIGNFGIGLVKMPFFNMSGYGHTGGIDGFSSVFSYFPDGNISYALTSNGTNFNNNLVSIAVLSAIFNKPYEIPEFKNIILTSEELDRYTGIYSSAQIPLKITVSKTNLSLMAQATGQPAFPLEPTGKDVFKFEQAGLVMEFSPDEKKMVLKQGGGQFLFTKEN
ncbi:MAG: peptidase [Bacteroidetes bacterium GWF2_41_61]|nr:MAG: peptidase [Bacteroidetes bacterium GWF2_41_61]OFY90433.1 MAG: peptidase [Bacteroidetes bacterium RIFOXYA12_FULL_40_10]HBG23882.1 peptidase [Rikenellaceae bacterium]